MVTLHGTRGDNHGAAAKSHTLLYHSIDHVRFVSPCLTPGRFSILKDKDGNIFIDRDGNIFEYVLQFLRSGKVDVPKQIDMYGTTV